MPVLPLRDQLIGELWIARKPVGLGQRHQMLVAVEFPSNLRVAHFLDVEVLHIEPWLGRTALAMHEVEVPIDLRAVVQILVPQKVEPVSANSLGARHDVCSSRWKLLLENRAQGFGLGRREEEASLRYERVGKFPGEVMAARTAEGIDASGQMLSRAVEEFLAAHRAQPAQAARPL